MSVSTSPAAPRARSSVRVAAVSGFLGSTLEYYDFFIYGSAAALFFGKIFFPGSGATGTLLSFSTLGVAYIARPLGAIVWGHFGDRLGRKNVLLMTLVLMGSSTFLVGCLPGYATMGLAAPVVLVALRLLQGLSAGGESPGSSSLTLEHAPAGKRAFYTSWTLSGVQFGIVISSLVFIPVMAMPQGALMSWGWRLPFWLSALVTFIAYFLRRRLAEPEVFDQEKRVGNTARVPLAELLRTDWKGLVRVVLCATFTMVNTVFTVFALAFATSEAKLSEPRMLQVIAVANMVTVIIQPVYGMAADRIGRKPVFAVGCIGSGVLVFAFFAAISARNWPMIYLTAVLFTGVLYAMPNAIYASFFPEQFAVRVRYTGMAVSLMLGLLVAGFTPAIAQLLTAGNPADWRPVAWMTTGFCVLAAVAALAGRETYRTPTAELGAKRSRIHDRGVPAVPGA